MCFKKDNEYFIQKKLILEMKGKDPVEKIMSYEIIKKETRDRLKTSYLSCSKKIDFYKDVFDVLKEFESDYLVLNLFYEKDVDSIITYLSLGNCLDSLIFRKSNELPYRFWYYTAKSNSEGVAGFLKQEFLDLIPNINENVLDQTVLDDTKFVRECVNWIEGKLDSQNCLEDIFYFTLLLVKKWNSDIFLCEPFNYLKAIVQYFVMLVDLLDLQFQLVYLELQM